MKIYSHPRSGTNFARALIGYSLFDRLEYDRVVTGHWSKRTKASEPNIWFRGLHPFYRSSLEGPRIYLYRDGRDVARSMWRTKGFRSEDNDFSTFLRMPLDWRVSPGHPIKHEGATIVEHWKRHLDSWHGAPNTYFVRYEDLLLNPEDELRRIAIFLGRRFRGVRSIEDDVGPFPSQNHKVSKWKDFYTQEDLNYFYSVVPEHHWGLYGIIRNC
jgi:hypothetical protein